MRDEHRSRRAFLRDCLVAAPALLGLGARAATSLHEYPYTLGVAAGYPGPHGIVLWTRLAPRPLAADGGMPAVSLPVRWEIALDEHFGTLADAGTGMADAAWAHAVHVESTRLAPDRVYWYRFHVGGATSPTGRFRTAPAGGTLPDGLRLAIVSCQQYEQGWYAAYRHLVADAPDLVVHVGDYIYENSWGDRLVRRHEAGEPVTLQQYRARYACYKQDPDLQAAHAASAWILTWDDHELDNDYANLHAEDFSDRRRMWARRAAAYRAWYEHQPVPTSMIPYGPYLRLNTRCDYGRLVRFHVLDTRQYRTPQPCPPPGESGGAAIGDCPARHAQAATVLGAAQEAWLTAGLRAAGPRWHCLVQTTRMAPADAGPGATQQYFSDSWDGYTAARRRLLHSLQDTRAANPVVLGGDVHSFWVNDLIVDGAERSSPPVATEFVTTSVTSLPPPEHIIERAARKGPHVRFATGLHRGYLRLDLAPAQLTADLRALDDATRADSACRTLHSWRVADGRPGAERA